MIGIFGNGRKPKCAATGPNMNASGGAAEDSEARRATPPSWPMTCSILEIKRELFSLARTSHVRIPFPQRIYCVEIRPLLARVAGTKEMLLQQQSIRNG